MSVFPVETISARALGACTGRDDVLIIDLRSREEYEKSHVPGAVSLPYAEFEENPKARFPYGKILALYCDRGGASLKAARILASFGYETRSVVGGYEAYRLQFPHIHDKVGKAQN